MSKKPENTLPKICPLCQGENRCAVIQGKSIDNCWCAAQPFPPLAELKRTHDLTGVAITRVTDIKALHTLDLNKSGNVPLKATTTKRSTRRDAIPNTVEYYLPALPETADACICQACLQQLKQTLTRTQTAKK